MLISGTQSRAEANEDVNMFVISQRIEKITVMVPGHKTEGNTNVKDLIQDDKCRPDGGTR